jgi:hypothetical protein
MILWAKEIKKAKRGKYFGDRTARPGRRKKPKKKRNDSAVIFWCD